MKNQTKDKPFEMPKGFPRPRATDGKSPVPYVAQDNEHLALLDENRDPECTVNGLCQMCGLGFPEDEQTKVFIARDENGKVQYDHGLTHEKCARIVEKFCPAFNDPNFWTHLHMEETTYEQALKDLETLISKFSALQEYIKEQESNKVT